MKRGTKKLYTLVGISFMTLVLLVSAGFVGAGKHERSKSEPFLENNDFSKKKLEYGDRIGAVKIMEEFPQAGKLGNRLRKLLRQKIDKTNYKKALKKWPAKINVRLKKINGEEQLVVHAIMEVNLNALPLLQQAGVQINTVLKNGIVTALVPVRRLALIAAISEVRSIKAAVSLKKYVNISVPTDIGLGLSRDSAPPYAPTDYTGEGVVVGVVDSGIDYTHEDFKNDDGTTRIISIWDHTVDGEDGYFNPPPGYSYGSEYTSSNIENGTNGVGHHEDSDGHGSHVAGTAAGNGRAPVAGGAGDYTYTGVAPEAGIIMVKYDFENEKNRNSSDCLIDGINYIFTKAEELGMSAVVNLSLGTDYGPHDGSTLEERAIDELIGPGKIIVAAAGNASRTGSVENLDVWGYPIHGTDMVAGGGNEAINFNVDYGASGPSGTEPDYVFFDLWYEGGDNLGYGLLAQVGPQALLDLAILLVIILQMDIYIYGILPGLPLPGARIMGIITAISKYPII